MVNKFKIIFVISLALNLLLIGMTAGFFLKGCHRPPPPELRGQLSPEHARLFSDAMRSLHDKNRDTADKIDATRREILQILTAPQFDANAYQAKAGQLHELHGQMQAQMTQMVLELASQLNAEERQSLAGLLEKGPPPPGGRGPRGGPPPRDRPGQDNPPPPPMEGRP